VSRCPTVGRYLLCTILIASFECGAGTRISPRSTEAFNRYVQVTEAELKSDALSTGLALDSEKKRKLRAGEILVTERQRTDNGRAIQAPSGMIQDWEGSVFVPAVTLDRFRAFLQDYDNYKDSYRPAVIESRLKHRDGDQFDVFLRLYKKQALLITVVLNVDYQIEYSFSQPRQMFVVSRSTRIAEVKDPERPGTEEYPVGNDTGYLWRLNSYWRVEEADGGVYARCEAVSLSRDAPLGLGFILKGFLGTFPRESMLETLRQTRDRLRD
jgi:hypothetical protein